MFEALHAITAEKTRQRPGRIRVRYRETTHPLHRALLRRLRKQGVFEQLASDLERQEALGDLVIEVGGAAPLGGNLHVDLERLAHHALQDGPLRAATALGTELARQVGLRL